MKRKPRRGGDPMDRQIELALNPGAFIHDRASSSFVSGLEEAAARIAKLAGTDPARATALYETFIAGCYAKVEELHDSSGSFGQFAQDLICGWIKARQSCGADPNETSSGLLAWMDDDPYAFCYRIEKDAAKAFDKAGLDAFEKQIRSRFEAAAADRPEHLRRRWSDVLRTLYLAQRNIAAYAALAERTGLTAQDCHALATLLTRRKPEEALGWVERGLELGRKNSNVSTTGYELATLHRELLTRLGRGNEAIDAAWAGFQEDPCKFSYGDLMKLVPKSERPSWHAKAMDAAKGADLHALIELLLDCKEIEHLAELVRGAADESLARVSHYAAEPAARKLEKTFPGLAGRLWRAQGMRILDAKKSKYYDAAVLNFERARRCYERAGLAAEWEETVRHVRAHHHRKTGFMPEFEALAGGSTRGGQPSFLESAKARWGVRNVRDKTK